MSTNEHSFGLTPRQKRPYRCPPISDKSAAILKKVLKGYSQSEVARIFGVSRQRVHAIKKRYT